MTEPQSPYALPLLSNWDFEVAPGSGAHHTHFGGLALHTYQNLEYAEAWARLYEARGIKINADLLYSIIMLHDTMKRFIYKFDDDYTFQKSEDPFIAKQEDHHSWVLREMTARGCDKELIFGVAAMHGIDDVTLDTGVHSVALVNHYLNRGHTGLEYNANDIRPEHVIAFLSDSDWHWSGQAQRKTGILADRLAPEFDVSPAYLKLYLGSRFTFEKIGALIEELGMNKATEQVRQMIL